jgi:hypothetical protein
MAERALLRTQADECADMLKKCSEDVAKVTHDTVESLRCYATTVPIHIDKAAIALVELVNSRVEALRTQHAQLLDKHIDVIRTRSGVVNRLQEEMRSNLEVINAVLAAQSNGVEELTLARTSIRMLRARIANCRHELSAIGARGFGTHHFVVNFDSVRGPLSTWGNVEDKVAQLPTSSASSSAAAAAATAAKTPAAVSVSSGAAAAAASSSSSGSVPYEMSRRGLTQVQIDSMSLYDVLRMEAATMNTDALLLGVDSSPERTQTLSIADESLLAATDRTDLYGVGSVLAVSINLYPLPASVRDLGPARCATANRIAGKFVCAMLNEGILQYYVFSDPVTSPGSFRGVRGEREAFHPMPHECSGVTQLLLVRDFLVMRENACMRSMNVRIGDFATTSVISRTVYAMAAGTDNLYSIRLCEDTGRRRLFRDGIALPAGDFEPEIVNMVVMNASTLVVQYRALPDLHAYTVNEGVMQRTSLRPFRSNYQLVGVDYCSESAIIKHEDSLYLYNGHTASRAFNIDSVGVTAVYMGARLALVGRNTGRWEILRIVRNR